jgi:hypothetical protein
LQNFDAAAKVLFCSGPVCRGTSVPPRVVIAVPGQTIFQEVFIVRKTLLSTFALALLLGGAAQLRADDLKPVAIVSLPSSDTIVTDLTFIGRVIDMPDLRDKFEAASAQVKGLDKTKPIGLALVIDEGMPKIVGFVGTTDLKALLGSLPFGPPTDNGDGSFDVNSPQGPVRVVQRGGWAVFSNAPALLKSVPADPSRMLDGMDKEYTAAVRFNVQNIPADMRDKFVGFIKLSVEASLQQGPDEDEKEFELRKNTALTALKQIDELARDTDKFTIGLAVDTEAKSVHADASLTFVAGSELAKNVLNEAGGKSDFAGFLLPNAALNFNFSQKMSPESIAQMSAMVKAGRLKIQGAVEKDPTLGDEATKKTVKELVDQAFDILESATKAGKMDAGGALILEPKALTFAAGGYLPDGASVEKTFKKFVEFGQNDPNFPAVKFDVETYKGVRFHTMVIPMKDEQAKQLFGDNLDFYLGVGEHSAYVAFGKGSLELLKTVIAKSAADANTPVLPFQLNVALTPIVRFINSMQPGNPAAAMIGQTLAASAGKDHLKVQTKMIENGASIRIEAEEGVLKVIGIAVKMGLGGHEHN